MFAPLLSYYLNYVLNNGDAALKTICNTKVPCDIILMEYKKVIPLEDRPQKEKTELWKYVVETFPEKTKEEKIRCCKVIHTIGNLIG